MVISPETQEFIENAKATRKLRGEVTPEKALEKLESIPASKPFIEVFKEYTQGKEATYKAGWGMVGPVLGGAFKIGEDTLYMVIAASGEHISLDVHCPWEAGIMENWDRRGLYKSDFLHAWVMDSDNKDQRYDFCIDTKIDWRNGSFLGTVPVSWATELVRKLNDAVMKHYPR